MKTFAAVRKTDSEKQSERQTGMNLSRRLRATAQHFRKSAYLHSWGELVSWFVCFFCVCICLPAHQCSQCSVSPLCSSPVWFSPQPSFTLASLALPSSQCLSTCTSSPRWFSLYLSLCCSLTPCWFVCFQPHISPVSPVFPSPPVFLNCSWFVLSVLLSFVFLSCCLPFCSQFMSPAILLFKVLDCGFLDLGFQLVKACLLFPTWLPLRVLHFGLFVKIVTVRWEDVCHFHISLAKMQQVAAG